MILFEHSEKKMGSQFTLGVVAKTKHEAATLVAQGFKEITRLETLLTEFSENSDTARINQNAGKQPVRVSNETFALLNRCKAIYKLTQGAFDLTTAPLKAIYNFKAKTFNFPATKTITNTLNLIGFTTLELNKTTQTAFLKNKNSKLSFASVGKGFAADYVKKIWQQMGVKSGYINASGDLTTFGCKPDGTAWKIAIANPENPKQTLFSIPVKNASAATSGDYFQYFMHNGIRYAHTLNPLTGYPVHGIKSTTVLSPNAELSDALATAVTVKGVEKGMAFINQLPNTHCILINSKNKVYFSEKINYEAFTTS